MKAIAVLCLVAMFYGVIAKSKKSDDVNKGLIPCLLCITVRTTRWHPASFQRLTPPQTWEDHEEQTSTPLWSTTAKEIELLYEIIEIVPKIQTNGTRVKIAVYYESLCPDSKAFIVQQLAPVWRDFRGAVKVKMVPYGKATHDKVNGKWQFTCHHGPDECYGNKVQSCILKHRHLVDTEKMDMIICLMNQTSPDKSLDTCLTQIDKMAESAKLKHCASGEAGDNLLAAYGDKSDTVSRPLSFVPTVIINESYNQTTQEEAFKNLKAVVCNAAVIKPPACSN